MISKTAPIVLFVYNRPEHTLKTIEALAKNELAINSDLFIFSDGPRNNNDVKKVDEVRSILKNIGGFKKTEILERTDNLGLAANIIEGVTGIIKIYGRIIVLEDDIVTSPYFLSYMNEALDTYMNKEKVMHISGYMFPIDITGLSETFFLQIASCWGWATWDRAWKNFKKEPDNIIDTFSNRKIKRFNMDNSYNFWSQIERNETGLINTWAVFWYATIFEFDGLCLHPAVSMVNNIGHDDTGENCKTNKLFTTILSEDKISYFEKDIYLNANAQIKMKNFFFASKPPIYKRLISVFIKKLVAFRFNG